MGLSEHSSTSAAPANKPLGLSASQVAVVGVGGVGGYFGGKLCQLLPQQPSLKITMIARGPHLEAIKRQGLTLKTEHDGQLECHPTTVTDQIDALPPLDFCLLCVKAFDLDSVLQRLKPAIHDNTIILPLLNGVDIHQRIRNIVSQGVVLPACVYVGTHIEAPGVVTQRGGACKILFGPDPGVPDHALEPLQQLLTEAKIRHAHQPEIATAIWEKFLFIATFGLVSAAHQCVIGRILEDPDLRALAERVVQEILAVAAATQVPLPTNVATEALAKAETFPYETKTSFQRDFEQADRPDERELFAGSMLAQAKHYQLQVPEIARLAATLERLKPTRPK